MQTPNEVTAFEINTEGYATQIYLAGTKRFTARDGKQGIPVEYHQAVKQYAATNLTRGEIDDALAETWINAQEHADTVALITTP